MTSQREVIIDELKSVKTHPTADQVYEMVRKRLPKISLGTVYRNLEVLSDLNLIQKLEVGGTQKRFDGNIENHYHVRCKVCGKVEDLPMGSISINGLEEIDSLAQGYTELTHKLELVGICPDCAEKED
jgi:Fur family ferric uptake transcriptional regulator